MRPVLAALVLAGVMLDAPADARWKPEYASQPQEVQDWYRNAELTPAAQKRFLFKKCCDNADVVDTRFAVNKTSGGDEWYWWDQSLKGGAGDWRHIPDDIIHWDKHAPDGKPTLFVYEGMETCFFPGPGGI